MTALGPERIAPGIQGHSARTPTLPPATHTNSYAIGERQLLLIEPATPYDDERRRWLEWARALEGQGRELVGLLITHHHGDHIGGAAHFQRELGVPLMAHEQTGRRIPGLTIDRRLEDGEALVLQGPQPQRWETLLTPGHAPGHVCLHEAEIGVLVVGDMVASVGTIVIDPTDGDMSDYVAQLARLRDLDATLALPAHGAPIEQPRRHFERYIAHRALRERRVLDAFEGGEQPVPLAILLPRVYSDTPEAVWGLAQLSLLSHLRKLVVEGHVVEREDGYVRVEA